jgi:DNA-binding transcriptional MerR regulator
MFTIKDIENLSGIKAHTIRIWEQRYSFLKPNRTNTNIRFYSNEDLKTVLNIAMLNKYGYKISHINKMSSSDVLIKVAELSSGNAVLEKIVNDLIRTMIELDTLGFEKIIDRQIAAKGIEITITRVLFPFFDRIGILWQTGHINPAQEHLITNIARQKIIAGIDQSKPILKIKRSFLLFLPEKEYHELGLLFVHFLLKTRGVEVFYIGANVPMKDARFVAEVKKPDFIYLHLTSTASGFSAEKLINQLSLNFPRFKIIISGFITHNYKKALPRNIQFKESISQLVEFISTL